MKKKLSEKPGWIKLYRKMVDWEWYDDLTVWKLFTHCLLMANFKDKKWHGILIKRGSFITSRQKLSLGTKLTPMQIRGAITKLKTTNEITTKTTNRYTAISVINYEEYQSNNQPRNKQITNKQPTSNQQATTTKEGKEGKEGTTTVVNRKEFLNKIIKWAYERNNNRPSCSRNSYKKSVLRAVNRVGVEAVEKVFLNHENAIQFLIDIKNL